MADDPIAAVTRAKYVLLTTFKRDGSAVPTPVWAVPTESSAADATAIAVWTSRDTGKVKRIRNSSRVTVGPCTMRGVPTGAAVEATATLLDTAGTIRVQEAVGRKYGWLGRVIIRRSIKRRGQDAAIGIRIDIVG